MFMKPLLCLRSAVQLLSELGILSLTKSEVLGCSAAVWPRRETRLEKIFLLKRYLTVFIGFFSSAQKMWQSFVRTLRTRKGQEYLAFFNISLSSYFKTFRNSVVGHKVSQCIEVFSSVWRVPKLTQCNELCPAPWSRVSHLQLGWKNKSCHYFNAKLSNF